MASNLNPYFMRAYYEWTLDNNLTAHIFVNTKVDGVVVPTEHISSEETIVLNLSPSAVSSLRIENQFITFDARFYGKSFYIHLPINSVISIYTKELPKNILYFKWADEDIREIEQTVKKERQKPKLTIISNKDEKDEK